MWSISQHSYCRTGHSSSFRESGIDRAGTASVAQRCVLWANSIEETNIHCIKIHPLSVPLLCIHAYTPQQPQHVNCFWILRLNAVCTCTYIKCHFKGAKANKRVSSMFMLTYLPVRCVASMLISCGLIWATFPTTRTSLVRHPCLVAHIKKTDTRDKHGIVNEHWMLLALGKIKRQGGG